ncbi:hypothetical protein B0H14DRAFT_2683169 [Mycena olivaceomarginata]|nr:hypothetical protein B0H14DRAFT_2683169 [Mycena olivaceomarginata]
MPRHPHDYAGPSRRVCFFCVRSAKYLPSMLTQFPVLALCSARLQILLTAVRHSTYSSSSRSPSRKAPIFRSAELGIATALAGDRLGIAAVRSSSEKPSPSQQSMTNCPLVWTLSSPNCPAPAAVVSVFVFHFLRLPAFHSGSIPSLLFSVV